MLTEITKIVFSAQVDVQSKICARDPLGYHSPILSIDDHGSWGGSALPFWSNSIEIWSGDRTNAMWPSRGGRLIVTP
jgi:hypothetical protein